jgi:hypothetical protein
MSCPVNKGDGCQNLKQCIEINNELDREMSRIKRLKQKYNLDDYNDVQQMYMINPNKDCNKSRHIRLDPMMYMLDMSPEARCGNPFLAMGQNRLSQNYDASSYRVNPNAREDFTTEEEEYVLFPKSNIPVRKKDLREKSQIRIYPHMFPQLNAGGVGATNTETEASSDKLDFGRSLGGVDYPVPMRFQLRYLQNRGFGEHKNSKYGHGGIDYDLRLKHKNRILPHPALEKDIQMSVQENVDFDANHIRSVNGAITQGDFLNRNAVRELHKSQQVLQSKDRKAHTVGVPGSDRKNLTCSQMVRNLKQNSDVAIQPVEWYRNKFRPQSSFYTDCDGCTKEERISDRQAQLVKPMSKEEKKIFGTEVDRRRPPYQTFPSEDAMKTSFFGLGPAIPPPNPLLLSNVPSNLLLSRTVINDPERSSIQHGSDGLKVELTDQVDVIRGRDTRPFDPLPRKMEQFDGRIGEGPFDMKQLSSPNGMATPMSKYDARARPAPTNSSILSSNSDNNEYSRRNVSLETDLKRKIDKVVEQQRQIMMQIADVRHLVNPLKQRELLAKDKSDTQDIHTSIGKFGNSMYLLNQLRQLQSFLHKQQKRLLQRLEDTMPKTEFLKYQTKLENRINHYKNEIKRYHGMPEDEEIQAFTQVHFGGDTYKMGLGFYDHPHVGGLGNNALQSLKIGKNVSVILYDRARRGGKVLVYHGPRRIPNIPVLWANNISGIEVLKKITTQVQLFDAPFFQGGKQRVGPGFYDYPSVAGIGSNRLHSLVIPQGLRVRLYSRPKKQGETIDFLGPQRLSFLPSGWNRKVSGIEVTMKNRDY